VSVPLRDDFCGSGGEDFGVPAAWARLLEEMGSGVHHSAMSGEGMEMEVV